MAFNWVLMLWTFTCFYLVIFPTLNVSVEINSTNNEVSQNVNYSIEDALYQQIRQDIIRELEEQYHLDLDGSENGSFHGDNETDHGNTTDHHGNDTDHHGGHHGIHVASWKFEYVRQPLVITLFCLVAGICKIGFHHANFLSSLIPESCLLIILGTIVGGILQASMGTFPFGLSPTVFFLYLLPPIILESAYSLHDRVFADNLGTILVYAVIGTILNFIFLGLTLFGLAYGGAMGSISISIVQCLVFSSFIVAVDPVAVLAIFQEIGVNNMLYFLVFGESLLNDAVTVVLYNMMKTFNEMEDIPASQVFLGIASFFTISLGGLSIGLILGVITSLLTRLTKHVRVVEPLGVFGLAYASYLLAEMFHFSGIISIIGCGLMQAAYAFHNISNKSRTTVIYFSKMMSSCCDSVIFMFLGLALVRTDHAWHTGFILWSVALCLLLRFAVVLFLTFICNQIASIRYINLEEQFIMAYGGLRGAVAFSLVVMLDVKSLSHQPLFETTTLVIIIFTVFVQGISIKPLVKLLRIKRASDKEVGLYEEVNSQLTDHIMAGVEEVLGYVGRNVIRERVIYLDNKYLSKWLLSDVTSQNDYLMQLCEDIKMMQHYENVAPGCGSEFGSQRSLLDDTSTDEEHKVSDVRRRSMMKLAAIEAIRRQSISMPTSPTSKRRSSLLSPGALSPSAYRNARNNAWRSRSPDSLDVPPGSPSSATARRPGSPSRFVFSDHDPRTHPLIKEPTQEGTPSPSIRRKAMRNNQPEFRHTMAESPKSDTERGGPVKRRQSIFDRLFSNPEAEITSPPPSSPNAKDLRKWMASGRPKRRGGRNYIVDDGQDEMLDHLREKQKRTERFMRALASEAYDYSTDASRENTPETPGGRCLAPQATLDVIEEDDAVEEPPVEPLQSASTKKDKPPMKKALTVDTSDLQHQKKKAGPRVMKMHPHQEKDQPENNTNHKPETDENIPLIHHVKSAGQIADNTKDINSIIKELESQHEHIKGSKDRLGSNDEQTPTDGAISKNKPIVETQSQSSFPSFSIAFKPKDDLGDSKLTSQDTEMQNLLPKNDSTEEEKRQASIRRKAFTKQETHMDGDDVRFS